jgi:peptidoglycan hydrolase-like protein with peptidoglycan-binding domain/uncharacterized protein YegP (UPF0339 family)
MRAAPVLSLGAGEGTVHGSPAVAHLQRQLRRAGFGPGPIDGRFGPRTEPALVAFQRSRHVAADGIAGPITGRALETVGQVSRRPVGPKGKATPPRSAPVKHGSQHNRNPRPKPRSARVPGPGTSRLPLVWILVALGVAGLMTLMTGYFQRPIRARAARLTQGISAVRTDGARQKGRAPVPDALPQPEPPPVKFLLYEDNSGGYYWTIVSDGGQVLARSSQFASYEEANAAADIVYRGIAGASFEDRTGTPPPVDLPASREVATPKPTDAERSLDQGSSVSREEATRRDRAEGWAWPAGSSDPPGGRRRD